MSQVVVRGADEGLGSLERGEECLGQCPGVVEVGLQTTARESRGVTRDLRQRMDAVAGVDTCVKPRSEVQ